MTDRFFPLTRTSPSGRHWFGFVGILLGILLAQIGQTKRFITNVSKGSFVLQLGTLFTIGVAGLYLLAYLLKQVFLRLPFVDVG